MANNLHCKQVAKETLSNDIAYTSKRSSYASLNKAFLLYQQEDPSKNEFAGIVMSARTVIFLYS